MSRVGNSSEHFLTMYVKIRVGEGATTAPSMFTPHFGKIKGQAELDLLALAKTTPSLKAYSVRPGMVDSLNHPEVIQATADKNRSAIYKAFVGTIAVPIRTLLPNQLSPTRELGKFLIDLALSDGSTLSGNDVEDGRIVNNKAIRRMAKEEFFKE
jgi:hypothetical protein